MNGSPWEGMPKRVRDARRAGPRWWPLAPLAVVIAVAAVLALRAPDRVVATLPTADTRALSPAQKAAVEATVREYILAHPEIIPEAMTALQRRAVADLVTQDRAEIETPYAGAWAGAKQGDVTLVEFFDYACPYCRAAKADIDQLVASDPRLRVVYREYPVVSPGSVEAALASLSAASQGRYRAFHGAMFADTARVSHEKVVANVRAAHLDEVRTARDLQTKAGESELRKNVELGRALGLSGTPCYIVGDQVFVGRQTLEQLKVAIAAVRAHGTATG